MSEEIDKLKQQCEIEEQNEKIMNMLIEQIATHTENEETLLREMHEIREYRDKIYNLKLNLGSYLRKAYESKDSSVLEGLKKKMDIFKDETCNVSLKCFLKSDKSGEDISNSVIGSILADSLTYRQYPIQTLARTNVDKFDLTNLGIIFFASEESKKRYLKRMAAPYSMPDMPQYELDTIRKINTLNLNTVFSYYEKELQFWQKKNLEKQMDYTQEEQYLE